MIGAAPFTPIAHNPVDWFAIAPAIALFGSAILIVLLRSVVRHDPRVHQASLLIAIAGVGTSAVFTGVQWGFVHGNGPYQALSGLVAVDGFAVFVQSVVLGATLLALLLFGGNAIHSFTAVMMFGVVLVGTYTSIFIAAPILIYLGVGNHRADAPEKPTKK